MDVGVPVDALPTPQPTAAPVTRSHPVRIRVCFGPGDKAVPFRLAEVVDQDLCR